MQRIDQNCWNSSCKGKSWQQQLAIMCFNSTTTAKKKVTMPHQPLMKWEMCASVWGQRQGLSPPKHMRSADTPLCKCSTGTVYQRHRDSNHGNCCHSTGAPDFLDWQFCVVISTRQASDAASAAASLPPSLSLPPLTPPFSVIPPLLLSHFLLIIKSLARWGVYPSPSH